MWCEQIALASILIVMRARTVYIPDGKLEMPLGRNVIIKLYWVWHLSHIRIGTLYLLTRSAPAANMRRAVQSQVCGWHWWHLRVRHINSIGRCWGCARTHTRTHAHVFGFLAAGSTFLHIPHSFFLNFYGAAAVVVVVIPMRPHPTNMSNHILPERCYRRRNCFRRNISHKYGLSFQWGTERQLDWWDVTRNSLCPRTSMRVCVCACACVTRMWSEE